MELNEIVKIIEKTLGEACVWGVAGYEVFIMDYIKDPSNYDNPTYNLCIMDCRRVSDYFCLSVDKSRDRPADAFYKGNENNTIDNLYSVVRTPEELQQFIEHYLFKEMASLMKGKTHDEVCRDKHQYRIIDNDAEVTI